MPTPLDMQRWAPSISRYADWIDRAEPTKAREWARRLDSNDSATSEGAVAEAVSWDFLSCRVERVAPGTPNTLGARSPDFICTSGVDRFAVEVTNISKAAMTACTALPDITPWEVLGTQGSQSFNHAVGLWKREIVQKAAHGTGLSVPYIVLVTTLHQNATISVHERTFCEWLLHSPTAITGTIDQHGDPVGELYESTDMMLAAFTFAGTTQSTRRNVSAAIVAGYGTYPDPLPALGIVNPDAARPFQPSLLIDVPFARFRHWPLVGRTVEIEWMDKCGS